jgi:hypothetical protein
MDIKQVPAHPSNFLKGRDGKQVALIVIHATQGSLQSAANWFANPKSRVSAHYGIGKEGQIEQYVDEADTAFHAGGWGVNQTSIGIEFEDVLDGKEPTSAQYVTGGALVADILKRYNLKPSEQTIRPHRDFRATKCPGDLNMAVLASHVGNAFYTQPPEDLTSRRFKSHHLGNFLGALEIPPGKRVVIKIAIEPNGDINSNVEEG